MNPKYGILGMLSYPYWMLYEYWAPIIEFIGLIITIIFACSGILNWTFFGLLLIFSYIFAVGFSLLAIYVEESTFKRYNTFKDLRKLLLAALIEPIIFHPVTVYAALKGNWEKIKGKNGWGDMTRKGFEKKTI
jgi:formate hydrogenlyase subunit 3/multisubunit Na+/H+ antiporter MnhD subunit